jgi:hypothetical protein
VVVVSKGSVVRSMSILDSAGMGSATSSNFSVVVVDVCSVEDGAADVVLVWGAFVVFGTLVVANLVVGFCVDGFRVAFLVAEVDITVEDLRVVEGTAVEGTLVEDLRMAAPSFSIRLRISKGSVFVSFASSVSFLISRCFLKSIALSEFRLRTPSDSWESLKINH